MTEKREFVPGYLIRLVQSLRALLCDPEFLARHRRCPKDFTRNRKLTFKVVMLVILQKSLKSIQSHLNELLAQLAGHAAWEPVTPKAVTLARAKLQLSAFVELNTQCVLPVAYGPERAQELKLWRGHRLIGFDSSLVALPYSEAMAQEFRVVQPQNQLGKVGSRYCEGRISVVYDLLNRLGLEGRLVSGSVGEGALALEQLGQLEDNDVVLNDCGYTGYCYLLYIRYQRHAHFVARCSPGSFFPAQELFRQNRAGQSVLTRIFAPRDKRAQLQAQGLPLEMVVRFVSVRLPDGRLEVLVTSLLDEGAYPTQEFEQLYHWRWGQETFHLMLKSRLDLENWSGMAPETVQQDFAAAVLLCNLESLLSQPAQAQLDQKSQHTQHPQQINRAVSYHTLKTQIVELLAGALPAEEVIGRMQKLFAGNPVSVRPERRAPRPKPSLCRSYRFQRWKRKIVF